MEADKNIEQELAGLLAEPNRACLQSTAMLNELLHSYPYYQPLHLLLAKANLHAESVDTLAKTSLYTNGQLLHQFLFKKEFEKGNFKIVTTKAAEEELAPVEEEIFTLTAQETPEADEQETFEEITSFSVEIEEQDSSAENSVPLPEKEDPAADEQETYEEIAEVDINNYRPFRNSANPETAALAELSPEAPARKNSLEDDFVFESIAATDFFAFEQNFKGDAAPQTENHEAPVIEEHDDKAEAESVRKQVSNYHDDKLPYTFLWWLDKTRKEHQQTFQPYAAPKKGNSQELQQQYVEHIFHIQSHLTGSDALLDTTEPAKPVTKDFEIINSFIKNDPQITPPNAEQIDNENKAKKSAEDQNDLVSETLANIYIEQMLYDKAIDTYEKLSLKFPEKSRYFADLIQSIEKKI